MVDLAHLTGVVLALGAALSLASQDLFIRIGTDKGEAYHAVIVVMFVNLIVLTPIVGIVYYPDYGLTNLSLLSFIAGGVFGTLLGRACKFTSIKRIGASRTAPIIASSTLIATALGVIVLDETLALVHGIGVVIVVVGVAVIAWETSQENPDELSRRELLIGILIPLAGAAAYGFEPVVVTIGFAEGTPAPVGLVIKTIAATLGFWAYLRWHNLLPGGEILRSNNVRWFVLAGLANTLFLLGFYVGLTMAPVSVIVPLLRADILFILILSAIVMPQHLERVTLRLVISTVLVVVGILVITLYG
jgi:drug/metabolite transporter (DMT)-like permease